MTLSEPLDHTKPFPPEGTRFAELDALRGVAAFTVVLLHFHDMWVDTWSPPSGKLVKLLYFMLSGMYNGHAAVLLFFVLSGYVLSLPLLRRKQQPYPIYAIRRILRIYGPYLGALTLAIAGDSFLYNRPHPTFWSQSFWSEPVSPALLIHHLLFLGFYNTAQYDFVIWSLIHELRISLAFPLLFVLVQRLRQWIIVPMVLIVFVYEPLNGPLMLQPYLTRTSIAQSLLFTVFFSVGILLATYRERISQFWRATSPALRSFLAVIFFVTYMYAGKLVRWAGMRLHSGHFDPVRQYLVFSLLTLTGAAGCIILAMNTNRVRLLLRTRIMHFLGRISYSLYLMHPLVLLAVTLLLFRRVTPWLQFPAYVAGSLLLGWLFCTGVEERFIWLSRRFAGVKG